ncbi:MAG: molybdenum cofactor guanylyltransferase [Gemmatimonadota bacterium]|nr:molybdenum cofactor guanylyltransferase [Gemmatimonadota bacterium]
MFDPTSSKPIGGVLVGGQSRRFGADKATTHVGGRSMAAWAVRTLRESADPVVLLGGNGTLARRMALPWCADVQAGGGPLSGVAAGLRWTSELGRPGLLVLACDLPLVTPSLMTTILSYAGPDFDAVVPLDEWGEAQPLCAWYASSAYPAMEASLASGQYSMRGLLTRLRVRRLPAESSAEVGGSLLLNVNTPQELAVADRRVRKE